MVMDVPAVDVPPLARAIETVAFGQEVFERPGAGVEGFAPQPVTAREPRFGRTPVRADAPVTDLAVVGVAGHLSIEVGQAEGGAGETDGHRIACVQAEEPDAGLVLGRDIGADVQLWEIREPGDA